MCPSSPGFYQWNQQFVSSAKMSHSEIPLLFVNTLRSGGRGHLAGPWQGFNTVAPENGKAVQ